MTRPLLPFLLAAATVPAAAAHQDARPLAARVDEAVQRGVRHLMETQALEGHWSHGGGPRSGATALVAYALIKSGVDRQHLTVRRAMASLELAKPRQTYDAACLLLLLTAHGPAEHRDRIQDLARWLEDTQKNGVWGYPGGTPDLSNTQYAAMGLWAAERAGAGVSDRVWRDLARALPRYHHRGAFGYHPGNESEAMTTAGVACASLCLSYGGFTEQRKRTGNGRRLANMRDAGLAWLGTRYTAERLRSGGSLGYYLYGLERACALADAREIGGTDWYEVGAEYLLAMEAEESAWTSLYSAPLGTSFALLFLRRATARRPVISGPSSRTKVKDLGPEAPWLVELASDHQRNLTASISPRVTASSQAAGSSAQALTDGDLRTAWEATSEDVSPTVTIDFGRSVKADTIALAHPFAPEERPGERGRALLVSVSIDGASPRLVPMRPESERRARIELPEPVNLRRIALGFPKIIPSSDGERGLALGEVQVLLRAR